MNELLTWKKDWIYYQSFVQQKRKCRLWWLFKVSCLFHWQSTCRLWNTGVGGGILFEIGSWPYSTKKSRWSSAYSANLQAGGNLSKLHLIKDRSSHPEVLCKLGIFRNFTKFLAKQLCRMCFPVNYFKLFLWSYYLQGVYALLHLLSNFVSKG